MAEKREPQFPERMITPLTLEMVSRIDDFRYLARIPSRAEAVRQLLEAGLAAMTENNPRDR